METDEKSAFSKEELSSIIESILARMNILQNNDIKINFQNAVKKLSTISPNFENDDFNNFIYLSQKLFLDSSNDFDYNIKEVHKYIKAKDVRIIFSCLLRNINKGNFFEFLIELGEIFTDIYSNYDNMLPITIKLSQKSMNNYECLLNILSWGKKEKSMKLIFANYDQYYSIKYINAITTNIIFAINLNYKLSISGENYRNIINYFINELFFKKFSNEYDQFNEIENFLRKCVNVYSCNCAFSLDKKFESFFTILYEFITENNFKLFIANKNGEDKVRDFFLKYIKKFSLGLINLLEDFNQTHLEDFEKSLYNFITNYIDVYGGNYYLDIISSIQSQNKISPEEIGLISMICFNRKFIKDIETNINNNENIEVIIDECGLNAYEELVVKSLFNLKEKKSSETIVNSDIKLKEITTISYKDTTTENNNLQIDKKKADNKVQRDKDNKKTQLEMIPNKNEIKETKDVIPKDIKEKIKLNEEIKTNLIKTEEDSKGDEIKNLKEKDIESLNEQVQRLNLELSNLKRQYEEDKIKNINIQRENKLEIERYKIKVDNLNEELKETKDEVNNLKFIHKSIYFRDISKFYINQFTNEHKNFEGNNLYQTCQNILKYDFKANQMKELGSIMIKIVTHYLSGNDKAHIKYFIKEIDENCKNKMEIIRINYNSFMKFSLKQQIKINEVFNLNEASYLFNYK